MPIVVTLDAHLSRQGVTGKQLAQEVGLSETQLSLLRSGKVRGVRFATLAKMCAALNCQPADLLKYEPGPEDVGDE